MRDFLQARFQSASPIAAVAMAAVIIFSVAVVIGYHRHPSRPVKIVNLPDLEKEFNDDPNGSERKYSEQAVRFSGIVKGKNDGDLLLQTIYILPVRVNGLAYVGNDIGQKVTIQCDRVLLWQFMASSKPNPDGCTQL
jgi:hypothetical protein